MSLDRDQLIKLLNLTSSKYDAEALSAIRHADALLSKHGTTWADLLALPQVSAKAQRAEPTQEQKQRPSSAFNANQGYWRPTNSSTKRQIGQSRWLLKSLVILFFPFSVFVWLYQSVVLKTRWRLKPVAMLVPIFGAATAMLIWVFLFLAVADLMG
jgi:hypothetical protein